MADDPMATEGPPAGRSDPGGGLSSKLGPLPIWGWLLVGGGILAFLWWRGQQSSTTSSTDVTGSASSLPADSGVTTTDPGTAAALLQAMQNLSQQLSQQNTGNTTDNGSLPGSFAAWLQTPNRPDITAAIAKGDWKDLWGEFLKESHLNASTSQTTGGSSTALASNVLWPQTGPVTGIPGTGHGIKAVLRK